MEFLSKFSAVTGFYCHSVLYSISKHFKPAYTSLLKIFCYNFHQNSHFSFQLALMYVSTFTANLSKGVFFYLNVL